MPLIEVGSTVRLKIDSPTLMVIALHSTELEVMWYGEDGQIQTFKAPYACFVLNQEV